MYWSLMVCNFKQQFQYRGSLYLSIIGQFTWLYIEVSIWTALLKNGVSDGRDLAMMVTYVLISMLIRSITYNNIAGVIGEKVRSGTIAIELIRPVSLKWFLFYQQLSQNTFSTLFIGAPVVFAGVLIWGASIPGFMNGCLFLISLVLSIILSFYFQYIMGLFSFWAKDGTCSRMMASGLRTIFSGSTVPLWFYPEFLRNICNILPFRLMFFEPMAIYLGDYRLSGAFRILGLQLIWILIFFLAERFIWFKIQNSITIQGG